MFSPFSKCHDCEMYKAEIQRLRNQLDDSRGPRQIWSVIDPDPVRPLFTPSFPMGGFGKTPDGSGLFDSQTKK